MTHPASFSILAGAAQINQEMSMELVYWCLVLVGVVIGLIIILTVVRKILKSRQDARQTLGLDVDFLDNLGEKATLTTEEKQKVREVMMRRYTETQETEQSARSVGDLEMLLKQAPASLKETADSEPVVQASPPSNPLLSTEIETQSPPSSENIPDGSAASSVQTGHTRQKPAVDIDDLLKRGLINDKEYARMRNHFNRSPGGS